MNWDQYNAAQQPLRNQFMDIHRKMEVEIAMGKMSRADAEAMKSEARDILERMFSNLDKLKSIDQSPDTMMMLLADVMGLKGEKRAELLAARRPTS